MKRSGSAVWQGSFTDGAGAISTANGALENAPYSVVSRFEDRPGTNPEELLGAAHAGCFSMAFSLVLAEAGLTAQRIETEAMVTPEKVSDGYAITAIHLIMSAKIPGANQAKFEEWANKAKTGCSVSKLLNAKISLDVTLAS
jgi:lipoyl-dependent peroxiredoxin